ncbi:hypothetical protein FNV43_RR18424 [Rhamnella rubrinervis]|uniref:Disease resistance protein RPM1-like n=1 Tax=Rhamnella rubrinervis TaxID=2594499 RepID=A0A8K0E4J3_9ROSA|nr:hypothetical protein FNV43_RR18424 [Rhamnella rubrinervis]
MASAAIDLLIGRIVSIIEQETSLIGDVRDDVQEIKRELESMKSFLEDAEAQISHNTTEVDKTWVASVRDLAYEVEDAVDEFIYHMNQQQGGGSFARFLHQTIYLPKNLYEKHRIATKLQKIIKIVEAIPERRQRYLVDRKEGRSYDEVSDKWVQNYAESSLFMKEEELVGIEDKRKMLMGWLMDEEPRHTVVSLVGMGGSGKTTLAANVYNNESVKRSFICQAWITVSQTYVIEELLRSLIKEFYQTSRDILPAELNAKSYRELVQIMLNYLELKRFLIVFDDVWDTNLWEEIKVSIPDNLLRSRIILTTRIEGIAFSSLGVERHIYHIEPLPPREAWKLFCMKAFSNYPDKRCPPEFESLALKVLEKCEGLPLAIVALGGIMSSKKSMLEWTQVCNNLNWQLSDNPMLDKFNRILLLSFNDLPYRLKHCFLYCSLFPEDYEIGSKRLIGLWMAEGFIQDVKGITPEEVAESYLMELISRSMLQVVYRNPSGRPNTCKMHDLMRELAVSISEKEKFCAVNDKREDMEQFGARRLSIVLTPDKEIKAWTTGMSQLRSLLVFFKDMVADPSSSNKLPSGFKLLRVLDLEDFPLIEKLPDELISNLFNLRYLNLRSTSIKELPKSISRLYNLQTLDIRNTEIETLPKGITKLKNLRHLLMYRSPKEGFHFRYIKGTRVPWKMSRLNKLQVLSCIISEGDVIKQVGSMTQLTRIGITDVKEEDGKDLCASLQKMKLLHYLFLMVTDEERTLGIDAISSPPPLLQTLILVGKLVRVPRWISCLDNLVHLYLRWSRLEEDVLPHIASLPCLGKLTLINAYVGEKLCFREGFSKLTCLDMSLPQLEAITIEEGVMPHLERLDLYKCINLKTVPNGIEGLSNLQWLDLLVMPIELIQSIRTGGVDRPMVQHIPNIHHFYRSPSGILSCESLSDPTTD